MKILCVDFDGVIHSYTSGWQGADKVSDPPVQNAFATLEMYLDNQFKVCIYSSRSRQENGIEAMKKWFIQHGFKRISELEFPTQKPAAWMTIDDRAFCFCGTFPTVDELNSFKPWNKKGGSI